MAPDGVLKEIKNNKKENFRLTTIMWCDKIFYLFDILQPLLYTYYDVI